MRALGSRRCAGQGRTAGAHQSQAGPPCPPPELPSSEHLSVADATWLALNVVSGGGSFSSSQPIGVTKIAKSVIAPLADQNISVFMLSTYQTDFILVSCDAGTPTNVNRKVFAPTPISWSAQRKVKGTLGSSVQCHMARARLWLHPLPAL